MLLFYFDLVNFIKIGKKNTSETRTKDNMSGGREVM